MWKDTKIPQKHHIISLVFLKSDYGEYKQNWICSDIDLPEIAKHDLKHLCIYLETDKALVNRLKW